MTRFIDIAPHDGSDIERIDGNSAGAMIAPYGARKLLLHSTEGNSIEGAISSYRLRNTWPHLTVDAHNYTIADHLPLEWSARSLANAPGGVQTNLAGAILVQIELVGHAEAPELFGDLEWFARSVVEPICWHLDIPLTCDVSFIPYPASYGIGAGQRLSGGAWVDYSGIIGHQHVPENYHGDPGAIDVAAIINAASVQRHYPSPVQEDDMPYLIVRGNTDPATFAVHGLHRLHLNSPTVVNEFVRSIEAIDPTLVKYNGRSLSGDVFPYWWEQYLIDAVAPARPGIDDAPSSP